MRCLVTGAAGFIGSTLVDRLLADGHHVVGVDDLSSGSAENLQQAGRQVERFRWHEMDVCAPDFVDLVSEANAEVVFHLAAQASVAVSLEQPVHDATVNVLGTINLLEAARLAGIRKVVFAASGGTLYGEPSPERLPISEQEPYGPTSPYGLSKRAALDYLRLYSQLHGIKYAALALSNVYGPRQDPFGEAGVIAIFAQNLVAGKKSTIFGDGEQTRDFVFVDDVVEAFLRAAARVEDVALNIGTAIETSVNELYAQLVSCLGVDLPAKYGPAREGEVRRSALDNTLARRLLDWTPQVSLRQGLQSVVNSALERAAALSLAPTS